MAPKPRSGETVDAYDADISDDEKIYYSGDDSEIESEEDLDFTDKEFRYKDALKTWYNSHQNRIGKGASIEARSLSNSFLAGTHS